MDSTTNERRAHFERAHDPARVLALSDGVFAIVITLLVLEIHVPDLARGQSLSDALRAIRPSFVAFLISFVVTAIAWAGHRDLFTLIRRTDRVLIWLNILYLLPLSILPFGASLISSYDRDAVALGLYGLILLLIALTRLAIWWYATGHPGLLHTAIDAQSRRAGVIVVGVAVIIYATAIAFADPAPRVSLLIYAAAPVLYFIGITITRASAPAGSAREDFT
jgi:uncharacterized membrane protein